MKKDSITLLGTGTCQLNPDQMASSILVDLNDLVFVFDFGRGVANRITQLGYKQDDIQHIILSHFHPDHVSDLIPYLHAASWSRTDGRTADLHIYGPLGVEVQMMRILGLFGPDELSREHFKVVIHEIRAPEFSIGRHTFSFLKLPPDNNHGLKFSHYNKTYAFTGDSGFHEQELAFLNQVDFAVIDAGHITYENILSLAVTTQANTVVCSHLYYDLDTKTIQKDARNAGFTGTLIVGQDLLRFEMDEQKLDSA